MYLCVILHSKGRNKHRAEVSHFRSFLKISRMRFSPKNLFPSVFSIYESPTSYKESEKTEVPILRNIEIFSPFLCFFPKNQPNKIFPEKSGQGFPQWGRTGGGRPPTRRIFGFSSPTKLYSPPTKFFPKIVFFFIISL